MAEMTVVLKGAPALPDGLPLRSRVAVWGGPGPLWHSVSAAPTEQVGAPGVGGARGRSLPSRVGLLRERLGGDPVSYLSIPSIGGPSGDALVQGSRFDV